MSFIIEKPKETTFNFSQNVTGGGNNAKLAF